MTRPLLPAARLTVAALLFGAPALASGAAPPRVTYVVEEDATSWQPLDPGDLAKTIEHAALEVLSGPGLVQLERAPKRAAKDPAAATGDYELRISGRTVDEAETHSVYLTFGPGQKTDLASFRASDTVSLSKVKRGEMLARVDASARKAATELFAVLRPALASASGDPKVAPPKDPLAGGATLPWRWADVTVPKATAGCAADVLYSKRHAERAACLRELTSLALTEASPRNALERCALAHPDKEVRLGCLVALRPLSRRLAPTARVVVEVFRKDEDGQVRSEASEQMTYFTGGARADAVQAWLESLARCGDPGLLDQLGDLPNLDLALSSCLVACGKKEKYQRSKRTCIEHLKPLPVERRRRVVWRHLQEVDTESPYYLEGAGEREGSTGTDWQWAVEAALEGARTWDAALEEILWGRYQRTLSSFALDVLADLAPPSDKLVDRLLEVVQTSGARQGLAGLRRVAHEEPKLRPVIREKLAELLATGAFPKSTRPSDLESFVKELAKKEEAR